MVVATCALAGACKGTSEDRAAGKAAADKPAAGAPAKGDPCAGRWEGTYVPDRPFDTPPARPGVDLVIWPTPSGHALSAPDVQGWTLTEVTHDGAGCTLTVAARMRADDGSNDGTTEGTLVLAVANGKGTVTGTLNDRAVEGVVKRTRPAGAPLALAGGESLDPPYGTVIGGDPSAGTWSTMPQTWDSASGPATVAIAWSERQARARVLVATPAGTTEVGAVDLNLVHGHTASIAIDGAAAIVSIGETGGGTDEGFDQTWRITVDGGTPTATATAAGTAP